MDLHICLITSSRMFEALYGGEGRFTNSLSKWLASKKYHVTVIASTFSGVKAVSVSIDDLVSKSTNDDRMPKKSSAPGLRAVYPPYVIYAMSRLVICFKAVLKMILINRTKKISIIHSQDTGYSGLASVISGRILRCPVIITSHGIRHRTIESQNKGAISRLSARFEYKLDLFCIRNVDGLITVNPYIKKYYQNRIPQSSSPLIHFIPIPIKVTEYKYDLESRNNVRTEFQIDKDSVLIGFIGRLAGVKNIVSLINAFAAASNKLTNLYLLLVGTGIQEPQLRSLAKSNRVLFAGLRTDIDKILSAIDIFVLPSFSEGLSTSLLEAMACSRAIICSNIPANTELITNFENGLVVDPNRYEELSDAILLLARDESLRNKLGERARETAYRYDETNVFPVIERNYRSIIVNFGKK